MHRHGNRAPSSIARGAAAALIAAASLLGAGRSMAQSEAYPNRPIHLVVTVAPGGSNDVMARLFAQRVSDGLKQPVLVENKPGGDSIPATVYAAKAPADGYTLLFVNSTHGIQPSLFPNLAYDTLRDFAPISVVCISTQVLVVNPSVQARNVRELAALAKAAPGKLNYATPGSGTPFHLSAELFKTRTGTDIVHIPYKGNAPAMMDLVGGRVQLMFANILEALPSINGGKIVPLATTGAKRAPLLPDVPTLAEAGLENAESLGWFGVVAPRATPKPIVAALNAELVKAVNHPEVRRKLQELGVEPLGNSAEDAEAFIRNQIAKWAKVIKDSGAKVDG